LLGLGLVFFALREGALAPDFVLTLNNYTMDREYQTSTDTGMTGTTTGDIEPVRIANKEIFCTGVQCHGDDGVCEVFEQDSPCALGNQPETRSDDEKSNVTMNLMVDVRHSGTCVFPFAKSGRFDINVTANISVDWKQRRLLVYGFSHRRSLLWVS
jgi:hypothetical protein